MSPEGVEGRFDSVGARKLGHLLAGRTEIGGIVVFAEGLQDPAEQPPALRGVAQPPAPATTTISTRRFSLRPAGVELSAMGSSGPNPTAINLSGSTP